MYSLAHYALFGSLLAAAAGALILAAVTVKHGLGRRDRSDANETPEATARRHRLIRLADTVALLAFAVSAGLGVVGVMQHTRAVAPAVAAADDRALVERLGALEKRLATAEVDLQARAVPPAELRAWEDRIARLESRLGAVEERAAVAERRAPAPAPRVIAPASSVPRAAPPAKSRPAPPAPALPPPPPPPSASPKLAPAPEAVMIPEVATPPKPEPSVPVAVAAPHVASPTPRDMVRPRVQPRAEEPSIADKLRRDWEMVKRHARRSGDEWRDGWDRLKRLFND